MLLPRRPMSSRRETCIFGLSFIRFTSVQSWTLRISIVSAAKVHARDAQQDADVAPPAGREPLPQPVHAAIGQETSRLRHPHAPGTQEWTYLPDADQRLPTWRRLLLLPHVRVGRAVGEERPCQRVLLDRDPRSRCRARRAEARHRP